MRHRLWLVACTVDQVCSILLVIAWRSLRCGADHWISGSVRLRTIGCTKYGRYLDNHVLPAYGKDSLDEIRRSVVMAYF